MKILRSFVAIMAVVVLVGCSDDDKDSILPTNLGVLTTPFTDAATIVAAAFGWCNAAAAGGCDGVISTMDDGDAFFETLVAVVDSTPLFQDALDCGDGTTADTTCDAFDVTAAWTAPTTGTSTLSFSLGQQADCTTGTISTSNTLTGTIDTVGAQVDPSDESYSSTVTYTDCEVVGDLLDVGSDQSFSTDGTVSFSGTDRFGAGLSGPGNFTISGVLAYTTDIDLTDGAIVTPFWVEAMSFNGTAQWDATPTFTSSNGGLCVGDTGTVVVFGADNTTDADDSCTLGGFFVPITDIAG